jgi:hypothetical protein
MDATVRRPYPEGSLRPVFGIQFACTTACLTAQSPVSAVFYPNFPAKTLDVTAASCNRGGNKPNLWL